MTIIPRTTDEPMPTGVTINVPTINGYMDRDAIECASIAWDNAINVNDPGDIVPVVDVYRVCHIGWPMVDAYACTVHAIPSMAGDRIVTTCRTNGDFMDCVIY